MTDKRPASKTDKRPASQDDIDALLAEVQAGTTDSAPATAPAASNASTQNIVQDDIDALLAEITKSDGQGKPITADQKNAKPAETSAAKKQPVTAQQGGNLNLTTGQLSKLVAKHAAPEVQSPETMISQEDIDALVQQLGAAVGGEAVPLTGSVPSARGGTKRQAAAAVGVGSTVPTLTDLPQPAGVSGNRAANPSKPGAVPNPKPISHVKPAASSGGAAVLPASGLFPVMAPAELRGARWLLVSAVVLLAICALAMGAVVKTIANLSRELSHKDADASIDADQFALALTAARSQLSNKDEFEAAQGVARLKQLRERFPTRSFELTLELARHWRSLGFHRKAADEYATIIDRVIAQPSDPVLLIENADSLAQVGENDEAVRLLYVLLAHERSYLGSDASTESSRTADDVKRDRLAVQQAYLLLGELLTRPATTKKAAPTADHHEASPEPKTGGHAEQPAAHPAEGHH